MPAAAAAAAAVKPYMFRLPAAVVDYSAAVAAAAAPSTAADRQTLQLQNLGPNLVGLKHPAAAAAAEGAASVRLQMRQLPVCYS
jgi:hypothetical protein